MARRREPQAHAQAREELGEAERLGDVVVGAGVETHHDVGLFAARGEHDDREPLVACPEGPADREAVEVGQRQVEEHDVDGPARGNEGVVTVRDMGDVEPFAFQRSQERLGYSEVVFDQEDRCHLL